MSDEAGKATAEELLPCPFCGGPAEKRLTDGPKRGFIGCFTCMIGLPFNAPYGSAEIAAWNSRNSAQEQSIVTLQAENEELHKRIALWFGPNTCSVCGGAPLASGRPCVCDGKGTMQAEFEGLRQELFNDDQKIERLQAQLKQLREAVEAAQSWICRVTNRYGFDADDPYGELAKLRAALHPQPESQERK